MIQCILYDKLTLVAMRCNIDTVHGSQYHSKKHHYQLQEDGDFPRLGRNILFCLCAHPSNTNDLLKQRGVGKYNGKYRYNIYISKYYILKI